MSKYKKSMPAMSGRKCWCKCPLLKTSSVFNCISMSGNIDLGASSENLHGH